MKKKDIHTNLVLIFTLFFSFTTPFANAHEKSIAHETTFTDISSLLDFQRQGGESLAGVAWLDYDADGNLDLFLPNGVGFANGLFRNNGDGSFTDVSEQSGIGTNTGHSGVVVGDIDNDGYPDIFLSGEGHLAGPVQSPTKLFHNNGNGTFTDISATAAVPGAETALSAAMADINNDGFLDLFITSEGHLGVAFPPAVQHQDRLYLNNGDLTFTDITPTAGLSEGLGSCVASFSDYNNDGLIDLFVGVCNDVTFLPTPFHLYRNNGDNTFTDVAAEAGIDIGGFWMSVAMGDYDNDGDIDIFSSNFGPAAPSGPAPHALYQNNGDGTYTNVANDAIVASEFGWGASFADFNNDGFLDLFYGGSLPMFGLIGPGLGNPGRLFINDRHGDFEEDSEALNIDLSNRYVSGIAQADFDHNGFPDLAIMSAPYTTPDPAGGPPIPAGNNNPVLLKNNGNSNHWLTVRLTGTSSNRMGIGARINLYSHHTQQVREVRAGSSFASSETPWPTFGLAKDRFAVIHVQWPSSLSEWFFIHHTNRIVNLVEGDGF